MCLYDVSRLLDGDMSTVKISDVLNHVDILKCLDSLVAQSDKLYVN